MQALNVSNIHEKIFNFFSEDITKISKETKFSQRESKLQGPSFTTALLSTCLNPKFSYELFAGFLKEQGIDITKQGIQARINDHAIRFLKALCSTALKKLSYPQSNIMEVLKPFSSVQLIDSSTISLPDTLSTSYKGCGGSASSAALKIQTMYDYMAGQIKAITLTSGSDNDQGFDRYLNTIERNALYLMDLGYFKLESFQKIITGQGYFVSRLLPATVLFNLNNTLLDLFSTLQNSGLSFESDVLMGVKAKVKVRLVATRLPDSVVEKRRRQIKKAYRQRGKTPSAETMALAQWSIYITNISTELVEASQLHSIYALRWQIELLFKLSKSLINIDKVNGKTLSRILVELYGKLLCIILFFCVCAPVRYQNGKEISFYKACNQFLARINEFITALAVSDKLKRFIKKFNSLILQFSLKDIKKKRCEKNQPENDF